MLSRVADCCYWMARYMERAEHTARVLAVRLEAMVEQGEAESDHGWRRLLLGIEGKEAANAGGAARDIAFRLSFDKASGSSIVSCFNAARENARQVREHISSEMWERINKEYLRLQKMRFDDVWEANPAQSFRAMVEAIHLIRGITESTMRHGEAFDFIELGRFNERAQLMCELLDVYFGGEAAQALPGLPAPKYFDWINLLKQVSAFEAYCKVYTANIVPAQIAEFLIFDRELPHSIRYAADEMEKAISEIAPGAPQNKRASVLRLAGRLKAAVDYTSLEDISKEGVGAFLNSILRHCYAVHDAVQASYISYGVADVVRQA